MPPQSSGSSEIKRGLGFGTERQSSQQEGVLFKEATFKKSGISIAMGNASRLLLLLVLIGPALLFVGHVLYAVQHNEYYFHGAPHIIRYFVAPLMLSAVYLLVVSWSAARTRAQVAAYAYAIIGGAFLFELYPYWVGSEDETGAKAEKVLELRAAGHDAYPAFLVLPVNKLTGGSGRENAVVSNLPLVPTVLCEGENGWVWFRADRDGFNNPLRAEDEISRLPVAVVGDSFIHGACLPREETIVGQLRRQGIEARGFGIIGHGPLLELETLKRHVSEHEPQDVVWCFYEGNDLEDLRVESRVPWLMEVLDGAPARPPPPERRAEILQEIRATLDERMATADFEQDGASAINWISVLALRRFFSVFGLHYGRASGPIDLFTRVMDEAKATVESWGGRLHLCYLPEHTRYTGLLPASPAFDTLKQQVLGVARDLGIDVIDISRAFDAHPSSQQLFDAHEIIHYSEEGAALAAELIADELHKEAPSPPLSHLEQ